ncbi:MAG: PhoPQ-activated pathogenicity-related family protein [Bacteroidota bacterium]|jgi:PhoPQ-activated pathogenicity-related protein
MKKLSFLSGFFTVLIIFPAIAQKNIKPEKAFEHYLNNGDTHYNYQVKDSSKIGNTTAYQILLTSQQWRGITWRHQLTVIVPNNLQHNGALVIVAGGANTNEQPNWTNNDKMWPIAAQMAAANQSIVAILKQTPNQPLMGNLKEDELISYTLHQYKKDGDASWPLLFPMVKSAMRSMDAIQDFGKSRFQKNIDQFFISGASKRGWTTWLTAATQDARVKAIAPMVIDMLNMPATLNYQFKSYGAYSDQIEDYVKLEIPQSTSSKKGKAVTTMIDPYSYRSKLSIPKMIFIGTNDEYWTVDAIKWYIKEIPGQTMVHYVPNAGHDLGGGAQALQTLSALYGKMLNNESYPLVDNSIKTENGKVLVDLKVNPAELKEVQIWSATSTDLDFRNEKFGSASLGKGAAENHIEVELPATGYKAFYVDFKYQGSKGPYSSSTRMYLLSPKGIE